jgi:hypothetical protein
VLDGPVEELISGLPETEDPIEAREPGVGEEELVRSPIRPDLIAKAHEESDQDCTQDQTRS